MNDCIYNFGGFESFLKTFNYTDTDSMIITVAQKNELATKNNQFGDSFVGDQLGQLHDDLGEEAVIIRGMWIQPKLYCLEYLVKENGKYEKREHYRAKGISSKQHPITVEDFEKLLTDERLALPQWQFKRVKEDYNITMETRHSIKSIGGRWEGRVLHGDCWIPYGSTYAENHELPVYSI